MVDLSRLILHSPTPAFKNFQSGEVTVTFSGTLLAPTGATATTLLVSGTTDFPNQPAIVNFFVSQDRKPGPGDYDAGDLLKCPPFTEFFVETETSPMDGVTDWPVYLDLVISGTTLTATFQAFNTGGTIDDLVFISTVFTLRYIAYLPTGTV